MADPGVPAIKICSINVPDAEKFSEGCKTLILDSVLVVDPQSCHVDPVVGFLLVDESGNKYEAVITRRSLSLLYEIVDKVKHA